MTRHAWSQTPSGHDVSARLHADGKYRGACATCGWYGHGYRLEEAARAQAADHFQRSKAPWGNGPVAPVPKKSKGLRIFMMLVGLLIGIGFAAGATAGPGETAADNTPEDRGSMAFIMCKDSVKGKLKAPSSATFRNFYEEDGEVSISGTGDGPYRIVSTVDAQNSFGAKIRNSFACTATYVGDDQWRVSSYLTD